MALLGAHMGSLSPSESQQSSQSQAQSGLWGPERAAINARTPGDIATLNAFGGAAPTGLPALDSMGLYPGQTNAFAQAIRQANSQFSGTAANRGMLSPENIGAIAGSAAQNVLPQFAPLISQNYAQQEQLGQSRFGQLVNLLQTYPGLLGQQSSSTSQGQAEGPGLGYQVLGSFAGGFGQALGSKVGAGGGAAKPT
jgi:hypothetical protein